MKAMDPTGLIIFTYYDDINEAIQFYEEALQLERVYDHGSFMMWHVGGKAYIGGGTRSEKDKGVEPTGSLMSINVKDCKAVYERVKDMGYKTTEFYYDKDIPLYTFHIWAPNGYNIEIQQFLAEDDIKLFH